MIYMSSEESGLNDLYKRYQGEGGHIDLRAAKELSKVVISQEEIEAQKVTLIAEGYAEHARVSLSGSSERKGEIVGFNTNQSGFYPANRYPLLVKWDNESEVFEYSKEFLILEGKAN